MWNLQAQSEVQAIAFNHKKQHIHCEGGQLTKRKVAVSSYSVTRKIQLETTLRNLNPLTRLWAAGWDSVISRGAFNIITLGIKLEADTNQISKWLFIYP